MRKGINKLLKKAVAFLVLPVMAQAQETVPTVTVDSVRQMIDAKADILLLDVRTSAEFDGPLGHIENSVLIPIRDLMDRLKELEPHKGKEIVVICRSGNRSRTGTILLNKNGFKAVNMSGGMLKWNKNKLNREQNEEDQ